MNRAELVREAVLSVSKRDVTDHKDSSYPGRLLSAGEIKDKQMTAALAACSTGKSNCRREDVAVLMDTSMFGSGKEGIVFAADGVYPSKRFFLDRSGGRQNIPLPVRYEELNKVEVNSGKVLVHGDEGMYCAMYRKDGKIVGSYVGVYARFVALAITAVIRALEQEQAKAAKPVEKPVSAPAPVREEAPAASAAASASPAVSGGTDEMAVKLMEKAVALYKAGNFQKAALGFASLAGAGNLNACVYMARMYENGQGVDKDPEMARYWWKKAGIDLSDQPEASAAPAQTAKAAAPAPAKAEQTAPTAEEPAPARGTPAKKKPPMTSDGLPLERGERADYYEQKAREAERRKDDRSAALYWSLAADNGSREGAYHHARKKLRIYELDEAVKWAKHAAVWDAAKAQELLREIEGKRDFVDNPPGDFYDLGWGAFHAKDKREAEALWCLGGKKGSIKCMQHLARAYTEGTLLPQTIISASAWNERLAEAGEADLAMQGVERLKPLVKQEREWSWVVRACRAAAEQGSAEAMEEMAKFCEQGLGVNLDPEAAALWRSRAAELTTWQGAVKMAATASVKGHQPQVDKWVAKALKLGGDEAREALTEQGLIKKRTLDSLPIPLRIPEISSLPEEPPLPPVAENAMELGQAAYADRDYAKAKEYWEPLALRGNGTAMRKMAYCCGRLHRWIAAAEWAEKAEAAGMANMRDFLRLAGPRRDKKLADLRQNPAYVARENRETSHKAMFQGMQAYEKQDYETARAQFYTAWRHQEGEGAYMLAVMDLLGQGGEVNEKQAYNRFAAASYGPCRLAAGWMELRGIGTEKNTAQARDHANYAQKKGTPGAEKLLEALRPTEALDAAKKQWEDHWWGRVEENLKIAVEQWENLEAACLLGKLYYKGSEEIETEHAAEKGMEGSRWGDGTEVEYDYEKAGKILHWAAEKNSAEACRLIALDYAGQATMDDSEPEPEEAMEMALQWGRKAAKLGGWKFADIEAELREHNRKYWIDHHRFWAGMAIETKNEKKMEEHIRAAAELGDGYCACILGDTLAGENPEEALKWYKKAAEAGIGDAMKLVANTYASGEMGQTPDKKKALEWGKKAAAALKEDEADLLAELEDKYNKQNLLRGEALYNEAWEAIEDERWRSAERLLMAAIELEYPGAFNDMGRLCEDHLKGREREALDWYLKGVEKGDFRAMIEAARYYAGYVNLPGVESDHPKALDLAFRAWEGDSSDDNWKFLREMVNLRPDVRSLFYDKMSEKRSRDLTYKETGKSIVAVLLDEQGDDLTRAGVGAMMGWDAIDNSPDWEKAREHFEKAAGFGHSVAMYRLGELSDLEGKPEEAEEWRKKALAAGNAAAVFHEGKRLLWSRDRRGAREQFQKLKAGKQVTLGSYPTLVDGTRMPIWWFVARAERDRVMLIANHPLNCMAWEESGSSDSTWETCSLRRWLNGEFLETAFTPQEREMIMKVKNDGHAGAKTKDLVFVPTVQEVRDIQKTVKMPTPFCTPYAVSRSTNKALFGGNMGYWWLRSISTYLRYEAALCMESVEERGDYKRSSYFVRPAVWVEIP